jgi:hypothetical protein
VAGTGDAEPAGQYTCACEKNGPSRLREKEEERESTGAVTNQGEAKVASALNPKVKGRFAYAI